jgi:hypothetical protein
MSTEDIFILMGPFFVLIAGMFIAFGIYFYNEVKRCS